MTQYIPAILAIVGALVALVNIIVQVLKGATYGKIPTNVLAVIVSLVLTLAAFFVWCAWQGIMITWYMVLGAVVLGFLVAYAAMFGYDKLIEALSEIPALSEGEDTDSEREALTEGTKHE